MNIQRFNEHISLEPLLVVLDIDETLIHTHDRRIDDKFDFHHRSFYVYKRPHVDEFLDFLFNNKDFKVAIWTAAGRAYANIILEGLKIDTTKLEFFKSEEHCTRQFDYTSLDDYTGKVLYVKNLGKIKKQHNLERTIIVDDVPKGAKYNYGNLVQIPNFTHPYNEDDDYLLKLMSYLEDLKNVPNVRGIEKRGWHYKY